MFFVSGIAIVTYNKHLYHFRHFRFPITLICFTSTVNFFVVLAYARLWDPSALRSLAARPPRRLACRVLPLGLLCAVDVAMTNEAFVTLSVPLTEVVKAFLPALIIGLRVAGGQERLTWQKCAVVATLSLGVALTSLGDGTFVAAGFAEAVTATVSAALKLLCLQAMLSGERRLAPLEGLLCMLPVTAASLVAPWWVFERSALLASPFLATPAAVHGTLATLGVASVLVLALNASSVLAIARTSALTLVVTGILRLVFIIVVSAFLFPDFHVTALNVTGITLAVGGVAAYQYERAGALGLLGGGGGGETEEEEEDDQEASLIPFAGGGPDDTAKRTARSVASEMRS